MKFFTAGITVSAVLFGFIIYNPTTANAGFFSFISNIFGKEALIETQTYNSQTVSLLKPTANPDSNAGQGGGDITIVNNNALLPDSGPMGTIADVQDNPPKAQINLYVVREGDSLSQIAKMFDVSVNTIIWSNNIKRGDSITPGQTLVILPVSGVQYTIKKGDTVKSIANKFKGDPADILAFNNLTEQGELVAGETVIIPDGEDPAQTQSNIPSRSSNSNPLKKGYSGPSYAGYYMRPVRGGVKTQGLHGYNGVDLADSCGVPILASASGDVVIGSNYGWNGGYGHYVVLSHSNGTQTLYGHMSSIVVTEGWHVAKGQIIGYMGSTGKSTGCHVHFEIRGAKNPF